MLAPFPTRLGGAGGRHRLSLWALGPWQCQASSLGRGAELIVLISWVTPGCLRGQQGEELRRAGGAVVAFLALVGVRGGAWSPLCSASATMRPALAFYWDPLRFLCYE